MLLAQRGLQLPAARAGGCGLQLLTLAHRPLLPAGAAARVAGGADGVRALRRLIGGPHQRELCVR